MTGFFKTSLLAILPIVAASAVMAQDVARLDLKVETSQAQGKVVVALFDSEQGYEGGHPVRAFQLDMAAGQNALLIEGLVPGAYGIKAFHDVNGNGQMDTNPFGMPSEPYAFSNNAVGNMGPAKWDRARFEVSGTTTHTLTMR